MKRFKVELNTRFLTVEQEDKLIDALENVECNSDYWSEFYSGEYTVTPVQLPECKNDDEDKWVYGKIIVEGEVTGEVLGDIYEVFDGVVPYTDNDPFNLKKERLLMDLIHYTVNNPAKGAKLMEYAHDIAVGRC